MKAKIISILSSVGALITGCFGACGIGCLASGCCGGTALLGFLSLSGATLSIINMLTPVFLSLTILSLGYAFYKAYKPKPAACCADNNKNDQDCCTKEEKTSFFKSKSFLWITTIICVVMWTYSFVFSNKLTEKSTTPCCPAQNNNSANSCCPQATDTTAKYKSIEITSPSCCPPK